MASEVPERVGVTFQRREGEAEIKSMESHTTKKAARKKRKSKPSKLALSSSSVYSTLKGRRWGRMTAISIYKQ